MPMPALRRAAVAAAILSAFVAGCGDDAKKPATQVAAKVNKEEISVHQINNVLQGAAGMAPEKAKEASRQILEKLIDQEVLVQQAIEKKVDRDPKAMQAIEASRRQILAQAYLDQVTSAQAKPGAEEIKEYYGKHPELFGERRIYRFQELAVNAGRDLLPALQEQMGKAKSLNDVAAWLKDKNVQFAANSTAKAAEQLPLELLPRFHQMKDGQIAVIPGAGNILIVQLAASQTQALDEKAATPFIEQYLFNRKRMEVAANEVKQLRAAARIEYMGEFTAPAGEQKPAADAAGKAAPVARQEAAGGPINLEKGVAGLK